MGKLKTSDSKGLSKAQTAKLRRENRTDEERHVILEADCLHHQQAKERETEEHHAARLQKDALGHQEKKQKGSPDQRTVRLQRKALAQQQAKKGKLKNIMLPDYRKMLSIIKKRDKEKVQNNVLLDFRNILLLITKPGKVKMKNMVLLDCTEMPLLINKPGNGENEEHHTVRFQRDAAKNQNKSEQIVPDFGTTIEDFKDPSKLDFTNFELSAETAVVLWHLNRGLLHFSLEDVGSKKNHISRLFSGIDNEVLTENDLNRGLLHFSLEDIGLKKNHISRLFSGIDSKVLTENELMDFHQWCMWISLSWKRRSMF
jgi:hypothetical protein